MVSKKIWAFFFLICIFFPFVNSAHYILGYVNDALDGTDSEEHTIFMWNPSIGLSENIIGSIGANGESGQESMYLLDCDQLGSGCSVGDILSLSVIDNGDGYISKIINVTVTGAGYDFVENLTLNSPPEVFLNSPANFELTNDFPLFFNCSFSDLDSSFGNLSLWGNWSGGWQEKERYEVEEGDLTHLFSLSLPEGDYNWSCVSEDELGIKSFGENRTLKIDLTPPITSKIYFNQTYSCGEEKINISCEVYDVNGIEEVLIEANSPTKIYNFSTLFQGSNNYSSSVLINESGEWNFRCYVRDNAGNSNFSFYRDFLSYSGFPEIYVNSSKIFFDKTDYIEGEEVNITSIIENQGCSNSSSFIISFFTGSLNGDQIGENISVSIPRFSSFSASLKTFANIGRTNIFVFADSSFNILESIELDNVGNNSFFVTLWQEFYGNVSAVKVLTGETNFTTWSLEEQVVGNVFVTDVEAEIDWFSLRPLGKTLSEEESLDDFSEVDILFGTSEFEDSISNEYLNQGQIRNKKNFIVNQEEIMDVAVINSTNNENFVTGILWDSSDDSDGEFSISDKEDLVFLTEINGNSSGEYGIYDYEIKVPVELRNYDSQDSSEIYLYYNLI